MFIGYTRISKHITLDHLESTVISRGGVVRKCLSTISRAAGFKSRHNWPSTRKFDHCLYCGLQDVNSITLDSIVEIWRKSRSRVNTE